MSNATLTPAEQRSYTAQFASGVVGNFINGRWTAADSTDTIEVFDPSTGDRIGAVVASSEKDADLAVSAARAAQQGWAHTPPSVRSKALLDIAAAVEAHAEQMVALECVDAGKPVTAVRDDELPGVLDAMRYFAGAGRTLDRHDFADQRRKGPAAVSGGPAARPETVASPAGAGQQASRTAGKPLAKKAK